MAVRDQQVVKLNNLGESYIQANNYAAAEVAIDQALKLDPHFAISHHTFGRILLERKEYARAIGEFEEALRLSPAYSLPSAYYLMGNAYLAIGDREKARNAWIEVLQCTDTQYHSDAKAQLDRSPSQIK